MSRRLSAPPWTVAYICRPLDDRNPNSATQILWVRALASNRRIRHVHVITSRLGAVDFPSNVSVHIRERGRRTRTVGSAVSFYRAMASIPDPVDFYFVVGGGPYPGFLLPIRLATGRPVFHWKALPLITPRMRFYARFCDDLLFTATPSSLPLPTSKKRVIGHGIDTERFVPAATAPDRDLLVLGRISPIKNIERAIGLVAAAARLGYSWSLDVVGPVNRAGREYLAHLRELALQAGVGDQVNFLEPIVHSDVPDLLRSHKVMLSFADTAFDKAVGEAMAAGLPVLTNNRAVVEDLPKDLLDICALPEDEIAQVAMVAAIIESSSASRASLALRLRSYIEDHHSLSAFFNKILDEVEDLRRSSLTDVGAL